MNGLSQADLLAAIAKEPTLTNFGMGVYKPREKSKEEYEIELAKGRKELEENLRQFQLCCEWLSLCEIRKTINEKIGSSYTLKHKVERYYKEYVTNGAFIAAVLHLGLRYKKNPINPNIHVALSSKSLPQEK